MVRESISWTKLVRSRLGDNQPHDDEVLKMSVPVKAIRPKHTLLLRNELVRSGIDHRKSEFFDILHDILQTSEGR